ncbi:MAG: amidohydrolase family protein [Planctomycetes bacterium]|nr:amidohydrolase family protein [Planctomycetota bacterium]
MKLEYPTLLTLIVVAGLSHSGRAQIAVRGDRVYTLAGPVITDGMVIIRDGKIAAVGSAAELAAPEGFLLLRAAVVTPGLVDAHSTVGLSGSFNTDHDRDQLERSKALQPSLRAVDAYNPQETLVSWLRSFGVTTVHTGHAPGELISGQTIIVKTVGTTCEEALMVSDAMVVSTLGTTARKGNGKSPGTRGKMMALLRAELIKAREYAEKREKEDVSKHPARDLGLEALTAVLAREKPLLITAHRSQDIASALRLAEEFEFKLVLDGAAEAYLLIDQLRAASVPIIVHPTMARATGERENLTLENAALLRHAGLVVALQSGYESYVPKTRVVLFEAAVAAAYGLSFEEALASITLDAARIIGVADRVGSLEVGKDGDLALYDGDPFEYTSHCIGVVIEGTVVSQEAR